MAAFFTWDRLSDEYHTEEWNSFGTFGIWSQIRERKATIKTVNGYSSQMSTKRRSHETFSTFQIKHSPVPGNAFDKFQNLLLVTMTESTPHAIASQTFDEVLTDILTEMGLKRMLVHFGRSPRKGEEGAKAPDASYMPKRPPRGWPKDWPSMVLEVAYSESRKKLMSDV